MGYREPWGRRLGVGALVTIGLLGTLAALATPAAGHESALLAVLLIGSTRSRSLAGLVASIAAGALLLGAAGWLVGTQTTLLPMDSTVVAGLGLAVGGGLGSVVWLLSVGEEREDSTETMTVDMEEDAGTPEPVDLFEANPDPIAFYAPTAEGPVVRAVNPAFEEAFGVTGTALEGTPLREGLLVAEEAEDVVAAARGGDAFDEVLPCETENGHRQMRVRLAVTGEADRATGYVIYTDADGV